MFYLKKILFYLLLLICVNAFALDKPETGDLVGKFEEKANKLANDFSEKSYDYEMDVPYGIYTKFLDEELNKTYQALLKNLNKSEAKSLILSQKKWIAYRDAEIKFIETNWTIENFGTSSKSSKNLYISSVTRNRVITLLQYFKNF
jgi:uncharacterized protein YecT (DUF1311 family)